MSPGAEPRGGMGRGETTSTSDPTLLMNTIAKTLTALVTLTSAAVSVSDGTSFETRSFFHSREAAAIQHISDDEQIVAVEGPLGWARRGSTEKAGSDFYPQFALGHQYHALLLYFDDIGLFPPAQ